MSPRYRVAEAAFSKGLVTAGPTVAGRCITQLTPRAVSYGVTDGLATGKT
jgi:hypothetical protein